MPDRFCVSLTRAAEDVDRATVAFVVANAALGCGQETVVFLSTEGVRLAVKDYSAPLHEEGFLPLTQLIRTFTENGGKILVCSPCFNKRGLPADQLIDGASIVGGAVLVEFLSQGAASISY